MFISSNSHTREINDDDDNDNNNNKHTSESANIKEQNSQGRKYK